MIIIICEWLILAIEIAFIATTIPLLLAAPLFFAPKRAKDVPKGNILKIGYCACIRYYLSAINSSIELPNPRGEIYKANWINLSKQHENDKKLAAIHLSLSARLKDKYRGKNIFSIISEEAVNFECLVSDLHEKGYTCVISAPYLSKNEADLLKIAGKNTKIEVIKRFRVPAPIAFFSLAFFCAVYHTKAHVKNLWDPKARRQARRKYESLKQLYIVKPANPET